MYIIPAIDLIDGKCVRLEQGVYERKKVYHEDPLEVAKMFADSGIKRLHLVDLDGAKASKVVNWKVLERIASQTNLQIDWGGGIKARADLDVVFGSGAHQATVGSIAAEDPDLFHSWLETFGADKLILGADLKEGMVATRGWKEVSQLDWDSFFDMHIKKGVKTIISTDIAKDGMLKGPATELYIEMLKKYTEINLVASGGIANIDDLYKMRDIGCYGTIVGKAIYEQRITLPQLEEFS